MATTTIRIEMANNSDARNLALGDMQRESARHNGGKVIIAVVDEADLDAAREWLEESHAVLGFEVRS